LRALSLTFTVTRRRWSLKYGDIHDLQQEEDARREKVLSEMGLRICAATEKSVEALSASGEQISGKIEKMFA